MYYRQYIGTENPSYDCVGVPLLRHFFIKITSPIGTFREAVLFIFLSTFTVFYEAVFFTTSNIVGNIAILCSQFVKLSTTNLRSHFSRLLTQKPVRLMYQIIDSVGTMLRGATVFQTHVCTFSDMLPLVLLFLSFLLLIACVLIVMWIKR